MRAMRKGWAIVGLSIWTSMIPSSLVFGEAPPTPPEITPPRGNIPFLSTHAIGTQNYICLPSTTPGSNSWVVFSPQATLSVPLFSDFTQQIATHFLSPVPGESSFPQPGCTLSAETNEVSCPTWQNSFDSSAVWGAKAGSIAAGSDTSCPNAGAIPCLLLKAVSTRNGQNGFGLLTRTTYIQRLATVGGAAPAAACKVGDQALVPYQANYLFYAAEQQ